MAENTDIKAIESNRVISTLVYHQELKQLFLETVLLVSRVLFNTIAMSSVIGAWYVLKILLDASGASQDSTIILLTSLGTYAFVAISAIVIMFDVFSVFINRWKSAQGNSK